MELSGNGLIFVGVPRERFYMPVFVDNRDNILGKLAESGRACGLFQAEGHRVDRNRDRIVERFLANSNEPEWLLMLDSDQEYPLDIGERLSRFGKPLISCLYFHRGTHDPLALKYCGLRPDQYGREIDYYVPMRDEVYDWLQKNRVPLKDGGFTINTDEDPLLEVDATGTGGMLVHRSILTSLEPPWFEYQNGWGSEDLEFCKRVKEELGLPIFVDLSTVSGHYVLAAEGQAQFRQIYNSRGVNKTTYKPETAAGWLAEFFGTTKEDELEKLSSYHPSLLTEHWKSKSGSDIDWYKEEETGRLYLYDLLRWNLSPSFNSIRERLRDWSGSNILEIGGGIGTVAIQLAVQRNSVLMVEPNRLLREFSVFHKDKVFKDILGSIGELTVSDSIDGNNYDLAVAIDVFEHMNINALMAMLSNIQYRLKMGGKLFSHNNWKQQRLYPMHYDHSAEWASRLSYYGFFEIDPMIALKVNGGKGAI